MINVAKVVWKCHGCQYVKTDKTCALYPQPYKAWVFKQRCPFAPAPVKKPKEVKDGRTAKKD